MNRLEPHVLDVLDSLQIFKQLGIISDKDYFLLVTNMQISNYIAIMKEIEKKMNGKNT